MANSYNPESLYITPTIVIGLGGSGVEIMRRVKARIKQSIEPTPEIIEFLGLDTEPRPNPPGIQRISEREFGYLGNYSATDVLKGLNIYPHIADWWFDHKDIVSGSIHKGARQRRPVGRLSLYVKWGNFVKPFERKARTVREITKKESEQNRRINVERDSGLVKVYLVGSLCGGTGSGIFLDVAFRVRKEFKDEASITGAFLLPSCFIPEIQSQRQRQRIQGNAYAALREINYFMLGNDFHATFPEQPYYDRKGEKQVSILNRPFDQLYLVDRSNSKECLSSLDSIYSMIAQQICLEVMSPIGGKLDARRANLQDLAGETSEVETNKQPLIVSSFATASLVLPIDKLLQATTNSYSANYVQQYLIGKEISNLQEISRTIAPRFSNMNEAFKFETIVSSTPQQQSVRERLLRGSTSSSNAGRQIDLSQTHIQVEQVLKDIQQSLLQDYHHYGVQGAKQLVNELYSKIQQRVKEIRNTKDDLNKNISQKKSLLQSEMPNKPGPLIRVVDWVISLFSSNATTTAIRQQNWQNQQITIRQEILDIEQKLNREEQADAAFNLILNILNNFSVRLDERLHMLTNLCQRLQEKANISISISLGGGRGRVSKEATDVFELATEVGWESYTGVIDNVTFNEPYLHIYPRSILSNDHQLNELGQEIINHVASLILSFQIIDRANENKELILDSLPEQVLGQIESYLQEKFSGTNSSLEKDVSLINYLKWFYKHVRYNGDKSRNSPIDPLQMLRNRCIYPFLEIDESRLGSERTFDTEDVKLIGIEESRKGDPETEEILEDFDDFEDAITKLSHRIDVTVSRHGYPLRILRDLGEFKKHYHHFIDSLGEKLHLHRNWPNNMPDLVIDVDNQKNTPPSNSSSSS